MRCEMRVLSGVPVWIAHRVSQESVPLGTPVALASPVLETAAGRRQLLGTVL